MRSEKQPCWGRTSSPAAEEPQPRLENRLQRARQLEGGAPGRRRWETRSKRKFPFHPVGNREPQDVLQQVSDAWLRRWEKSFREARPAVGQERVNRAWQYIGGRGGGHKGDKASGLLAPSLPFMT